MGDQDQSQGRDENGAIPTDQWPSKGLDNDKVDRSAAAGSDDLTTQPYGEDMDTRQRENAERTGRTEEVAGENRSFKSDKAGEQPVPNPNDLTGPAGDPAEGKPAPDSYPA